MADQEQFINAMPTKAFFVDILIRDIPLERAILDLVDNCIDGAKRLHPEDEPNFAGLEVEITVNSEQFQISDNCGGFSVENAKLYAFRFGRDDNAESTDWSIGQFGVGMKRALFKFGRHFTVSSTTAIENWKMHVDVDQWEREQENWHFDFDKIETIDEGAVIRRGVDIVVTRLRPEVASKFGSEYFLRILANAIRRHQRKFISYGLNIILNGNQITASELEVFSGGKFQPLVEEYSLEEDTDAPIYVKIIAGIHVSKPSAAGWYILCNGRVVLASDQSENTGWNTISDDHGGIPKYHNQYARFRGMVYFTCKNSKKLPWNTTKTALDESSAVWQVTYVKMLEHMRTLISFLNKLDADVEEYGTASSPLLHAINNETESRNIESFEGQQNFTWNKKPREPGPKMIKIQYSRPEPKIEYLKSALALTSAKAIGETSFDIIFAEQGGEE